MLFDDEPEPAVRKEYVGGNIAWPNGTSDDSDGEGEGLDGEDDVDEGLPVPEGYEGGYDASLMISAARQSSKARRAAAANATRALLASKRFEAFALRIVYQAGRTGFEENKELSLPSGCIIANRYKVRDVLGSAAFSTALAAKDLVSREEVCLKVIKNNKDYVDQSLDEIKLLRYINAQGDPDAHHVVRLIDCFYHREHLFLVTELLKDNLYEFQRYTLENGYKEFFTLPRVQRIARQVLAALAFIHGNGLIHCDLKPENILIKSYSRCEVKVIDFGSSCFITDHLSSYIQSRSYRAPEVILGLPYCPKIDLWSVGCILFELLTGQVLFPNDSVQLTLARMQSVLGPFPQQMLDEGSEVHKYFTSKGDVFEAVEEVDTDGEGRYNLYSPKRTNLRIRSGCQDPLFLDFLTALLSLDPAKRPTAAQALRHPWLAVEYEYEPYVMNTPATA